MVTTQLGVVISAPSVTASKTGPVNYTLTYSGPSGFTTAGAASIQNAISLNASVNANADIQVSQLDNAHYTVTLINITGAGTLGISLAAGTASDGGGNVADAAGPSATFLVDLPPSASVLLNTNVPNSNDILTATVTPSDPDNDPVVLTYVWKVNGVTKRTVTKTASVTDVFDLSITGNGTKFDTITVEVTPNDGTIDGVIASAAATVGNTTPAVTGVQFTIVKHAPASGNPSEALLLQSDDTLVATVAASDADGDAVLLNYVWKVNGAIKKRNLSTYTLTDSFDASVAGNGDAGDVITLEVTPNDTVAVGITFTSNATIAAPTFSSSPSFSAGTTVAGLIVTFSASANPSDSSMSWNFGDGISDVSGTAVQHIYAAAGSYTVTVSLEDPQSHVKTTTTLTVTVSSGNALPNTIAVRVTSGQVKLGGATDSIVFKAAIPFPMGGNLTTLPMTVTIGGITQTFNFDNKGVAVNAPASKAKLTVKSKSDVISDQLAALQVTLSGTGFKNLIGQGVALDSNGLPTRIGIVFGFNAKTFSYVDVVTFKTSSKTISGKFGLK